MGLADMAQEEATESLPAAGARFATVECAVHEGSRAGEVLVMLICPYCENQLASYRSACCGERGHAVEEPDPDAEEQLTQQAAAAAEEHS
jgi:hypothetical protein